jgi:hypothetical protein
VFKLVELLDDLEALKKHAERCREILYMMEPAGSRVERIEGADRMRHSHG